VLPKIIYWLAVLIVSLAIVVALVYVLESRDDSSLDVPTGALIGVPA
jgi:hypothetical protein